MGMTIIGEDRLQSLLSSKNPQQSLAVEAGSLWADVAAEYPALGEIFGVAQKTGVFTRLLVAHTPLAAAAIAEQPKLGQKLRTWWMAWRARRGGGRRAEF
jgi:hypothetical protein